jgi:hypothetical protein
VSVAIENVRDPTVTLWTHSVEDVTVILTVETQCAIGFTTDLESETSLSQENRNYQQEHSGCGAK